MTVVGMSLLLAACSVAQGQTGDSTPSAPAAPAAPPGPAPMPEPVTLADRPDAGPGERLYIEKCIMCHGPNGMGQGLLARRGIEPDLEKRDNLAKNYVILAARQGIGNMPAIPRGEVSDEQMALIAEYLAAGPHGVTP
jgi:mono/diheme cytochrome c family protein